MKLQYFILVFLIPLYVKTYEYHLQNRTYVYELDRTVSHISITDDDNMMVLKQTGDTYSVYTLQGGSYRRISEPLYFKNLTNVPILTQKDIYTNDGQTIKEYNVKDTVSSLNFSQIRNSSIFVNSTTFISSYMQKGCPTLLVMNLKTNQTNYIVYQQGMGCRFNLSGILRRIDQNRILYAIGQNIYILDNNLKQEAKIEQKMSESNMTFFKYASSFVDSKTGQAIIAVQNTFNYIYLYRQSKNMTMTSKLYNPTLSFQLTSANSAISFEGGKIYRWKNLENITKYISRGSPCMLINTISLFNNESYAVIGAENKDRQYGIGLSILEDNHMKIKYFIALEEGYQAIYQSGAMISDDTAVFMMLKHTQKSYKTICKVTLDPNEMKIQIMKDEKDKTKDATCSAFGLINDEKLVTVCNNSYTYEFQLRRTSDLSIISSLTLAPLQNYVDIKILTNSLWNGRVAILIKETYQDQLSKTAIYQINDDKISTTQYGLDKQINFTRSWVTDKYIITLKEQGTQDVLNVYLGEKLQKISSTAFEMMGEKMHKVLVHKNIVVINHNYSPFLSQVYDFSLDKDNWLKNTFFKDDKPFYAYGYIIYLSNLTLYEYSSCYGSRQEGKAIIGFYSLQQPQISNIQSMGELRTFFLPYKYIYTSPQQTVDSCGSVLYATDSTVYQFKDCQPFHEASRYPLASKPDFYADYSYFITADNKYLLISYLSLTQIIYKIEIRSISNLNHVVWSFQSSSKVNNIAYIEDEKTVIFNTDYALKFFHFPKQITPATYQINSFKVVDANEKQCMVFAGISTINPEKTKIIYRNYQSTVKQLTTETDNVEASLIVIDENCQYFSILIATRVQIWKITDLQLIRIYSQVINNVTSLKMKMKKLIVQITGLLYIYAIEDSSILVRKIKNPKENNNEAIIQYEISSDGKFLAKTYDQIMLEIVNMENLEQIAVFDLYADKTYNLSRITSFSFGSNGNLYMATSNYNLFNFSPTPCDPSQISVNLECKCDYSFIDKNTYCLCQKGYVDHQKCLDCDFPCQTCSGAGMNCKTYVAGFYVLIVGGILIFLAIIGFILYKIKKSRQKKLVNLETLEDDDFRVPDKTLLSEETTH